ncbi:MAG TPA: ABC transporter permease [Chloroflexota bacterium]|nr:ABC transporter permease [Chloroflexota bacterium]
MSAVVPPPAASGGITAAVKPVGAAAPGAPSRRRGPQNFYVSTARRLLRSRSGTAGLIALILLVVVAIFAEPLAPYDPLEQFADRQLMPPSAQHLFGTDDLGRDILSRVIYGARVSLFVGIVAVVIGSTVGISTGLIAGFAGGWLDAVIMRIWDVLFAFPSILIGIAIAAILGPGVTNAALALAVVSIPQFSRITRAAVIVEKAREYVQAARSIGVSESSIALRHVLPNTVSPLLVQLSLAMGYAVLLEAGLSFLGLGARPPEPTWGGMLNTSRQFLREAPYFAIFPGIVLSVLLLGLNYLSDALRDALDPKLVHLR